MMLQRPHIFALWTFAIVIACLTNLHADEPLFLRGTEITSQLEIESSALRKSIRNGEFTFDLTVTNRSGQDYKGPLVLVVEKTGVESLVLKKVDNQFADDGQGFLDLVKDNESLKAGETLKLRRLRLSSDADLETDPADQFSPVARVYKLKTGDRIVAQRDEPSEKTELRQGLPGGIPFRHSAPVSGQSSRQSPEGLKPVPDPIGDTGDAQVAGAGDDPSDGQPNDDPQQESPSFDRPPRVPTDEELEQALAAKNAWTEKLFEIEGVHSIGRGWGKEGNAVVTVKVEDFDQKKSVPSQLDGVPVEVYVAPIPEAFDRRGQIGYFRPLDVCEDGDPREFYDRPSKIGVSGWNINIFLCATGTLGCRLEDPDDPSIKYILSNSHVLADGGLGLSGAGFPFPGDPVYQPGPIDFNCANAPNGQVGRLVGWSTFDLQNPNVIDAAIARTGPLFFGTATPCNGYGVPRETTEVPVIGTEVMKYGRTTKFTTGVVVADNVALPVNFSGTLIDFVLQIEIVPDPEFANFGFSGDSGSLIVTRDGRHPVALLFAGNIFSTFANPIDFVLFAAGGLRVDGEP